jgi:3-dehydroquinate synthase
VRRIEVGLGDRSYPILIGEGLLDRTEELLAPFARHGRLVVVTDSNVWRLHGEAIAARGLELLPIILPQGEEAKSWPALTGLVDRLLGLGIERSDHILAFGGGAIGDVTGFAAAIMKRGCSYVQIPTTLLAQVDSSVGGKTAINAAAGKNLVGAFHQPAAVLIDPATLDTLPERELRAGYAEVVKYGLIGDPGFFAWCDANAEALIAEIAPRSSMRSKPASAPRRRSWARTSGRRAESGRCSTSATRSAMRSRPRPASAQGCFMAKRWRSGWPSPSASRPSAASARPPMRSASRRICGGWACR